MDQKIQLKHPHGKKAIAMPKDKYDLLRPVVLKFLRERKTATLGEINAAIQADFKKNKTRFQGSIPWHLEWIKLDLEARKLIRRVTDTSPQQYSASRNAR
jgi:hypothetical protein